MKHRTHRSPHGPYLLALCLLWGGTSAARAQSQAPVPPHAAPEKAVLANTLPPSTGQATFDFRYQSRSNVALQVFDDGQDTFVTFPVAYESMPLLVVNADNQPIPVVQKTQLVLQHAPHNQHQVQLRLSGLHRHFWWHWPEQAVLVRYIGTRTAPANTAPANTAPANTAPATPPLELQQAPSATKPQPAPAPAVWDIQLSDRDLATVFERWTQAAGMKLLWDARQHFLVAAADRYTGRFEDAIARVLGSPSIRQSKYPLEACIHPNTPPVLRITRLGEQDCPQ